MDGQNFQNDVNTTVEEGVQTTEQTTNYQDNTADVQPAQVVVEQPKQSNTLAVVSLILGILAIVCGCCMGWVGCLFGIGGIICAIFANKQGKSGMATAGLVCSIIGILLGIAMTIFSVAFTAALMEELSSAGYYY